MLKIDHFEIVFFFEDLFCRVFYDHYFVFPKAIQIFTLQIMLTNDVKYHNYYR